VAFFAACLFAFVLAFSSFDAEMLSQALPDGMPRRWPGGFMVASGVATFAIWITEP
jgi:hypothetical protein